MFDCIYQLKSRKQTRRLRPCIVKSWIPLPKSKQLGAWNPVLLVMIQQHFSQPGTSICTYVHQFAGSAPRRHGGACQRRCQSQRSVVRWDFFVAAGLTNLIGYMLAIVGVAGEQFQAHTDHSNTPFNGSMTKIVVGLCCLHPNDGCLLSVLALPKARMASPKFVPDS